MIWSLDITLKNRKVLHYFLETLSLEQLNTIPNGFKNNIIWNINHVIVTQQLLVYVHSGLQPIITETMVHAYRKGTKPENSVTRDDVEMAKSDLFSTIEKTEEDYQKKRFKAYKPLIVSTKNELTNVDEAIEFNNFHEGIHLGYILALKNVL